MIIINFFSKRKKYLARLPQFFDKIHALENQYITKKTQNALIRKYKPVYYFFKKNIKNKQIKKFLKLYSNLPIYFETQNSIYLKNELQTYDNLLNNIDGKSLDFQQKIAVLSDEINNLVIARRWKWKNTYNFWKSKIFD